MLIVASETGHVYSFTTKSFESVLNSQSGRKMIRSCLQNVSNSESKVESVINADSIINNKINDDNYQANVEFEGIELTINFIFFITSKLIFIEFLSIRTNFKKLEKASSDGEVFELEERLLLQDDKETSMSQTLC